MTLVRTTITLPQDVLDRVDELAGDGGRSAWIVAAVEARLKRDRLGRAIEETRGVLQDSPTWRTADEAYWWVRGLREEGED